MNLKAASVVLLAIFIILAVILLFLTGQAKIYGEFCRGEGYELAGTVGGETACLIVNDKNAEYRYFSCDPSCCFEGEQKTQPTTPTHDLITDLNQGPERRPS